MRSGTMAEAASRFGLTRCDRCGSCAAVCPMREVYPDFARRFAPRSTIARLRLTDALDGGREIGALIDDRGLWLCLTCDACLNVCPQGVEFRDFVEHLRKLALESGMSGRFTECSRCGRPYLPKEVVQALGQYLPDDESREMLLTCPKCRRREYSRKLRPPGIERRATSSPS
jgi:Fe-S oxidoreductase